MFYHCSCFIFLSPLQVCLCSSCIGVQEIIYHKGSVYSHCSTHSEHALVCYLTLVYCYPHVLSVLWNCITNSLLYKHESPAPLYCWRMQLYLCSPDFPKRLSADLLSALYFLTGSYSLHGWLADAESTWMPQTSPLFRLVFCFLLPDHLHYLCFLKQGIRAHFTIMFVFC